MQALKDIIDKVDYNIKIITQPKNKFEYEYFK